MIGVIDYGLGNIRAFSNIYKSFDIPHRIITQKHELNGIEKIILPGVGAFDDAMKKFNTSGMRNTVEKMVFENKIPILGVCVGLQMLGNSSDEGVEEGLGWIDANVKILDTEKVSHSTKLPHMGWNTINIINKEELLFNGIHDKKRFYFLHSYYFDCNHEEDILTLTNYGFNFASSAKKGNIYGVQFHPEKSLENGEKLLFNFAKI